MDGGWGWFVLVGTFLGEIIYGGTVLNLGVYMVEWQRSFSVGASAVAVVATEVTVGGNAGGIYISSPPSPPRGGGGGVGRL